MDLPVRRRGLAGLVSGAELGGSAHDNGKKELSGNGQLLAHCHRAFRSADERNTEGALYQKGFAGADLPSAEQSPAAVSMAEARVFDGDLAEDISKLKGEPAKPILAIGGAGFMRCLLTTGLIDEYHLVTHPVILGSGLPIFTELAKRLYLKLVDTKVFPGGITVHAYHPT